MLRIRFPVLFCVPPWSYLTGGNVFDRREFEFALVRSIYFVCMALALQYLFRRRQPGKQFQMLTGLFPVYACGVIRALAYPPGSKPRYRPNNRAAAATTRSWIWAVLPQLILLGANVLLPFYAIVQRQVPGRLIATNIVISALAIWSLMAVILAASRTASPAPEASPEQIHGAAI